jgi:ADP-heptose:LPS heptosyltransferase
MVVNSKKVNIVIFRSGLIGDTLVSLPALSLLRNIEPFSSISLISVIKNKNHITPQDILINSGLINRYLELRIYNYKIVYDFLKLIFFLLSNNIKVVFNLESVEYRIKRKKHFFSFFGVNSFVYGDLIYSDKLSEYLVRVVSNYYEFKLPKKNKWDLIFNFSVEDSTFVEKWIEENINPLHVNKLVAFGINANYKSKIWDIENYIYIAVKIIENKALIPVLFGGANDSILHEEFIGRTRVGYNLAGVFNIRQSIYLMKHMQFYIGNDTGVMHMAAINMKKCFAIFSSIDLPNKWEPYGNNHIVYRSYLPCSGCLLRTCLDKQNLCLKMINKESVYNDISVYLENNLVND